VAGAELAPSGMIAAGAVTALALLGRERCVGIRTLPMSGTKNKQHALVVVAGQAGIGADIILLRLGSGSKKEQKDEETGNGEEGFHGCPIAVRWNSTSSCFGMSWCTS
jgi:hypothetical protein